MPGDEREEESPLERNAEGYQRVGPLANVPRLLRELDADPVRVLTSVGLAADALDDEAGTISYVAAARLLAACVQHTGCEHFGLRLGRLASLERFGPLGRLMRSAPTFGAAIFAYVANQQRYARGAVAYFLAAGDTAIIGYAIYQPRVPAVEQVADLVIGVGCNFLRELSGLAPDEILLAHAAPRDIEPYRRLLPAPVRFDAEQSGLVVPVSALARPVATADAAVHDEMQRLVSAYWAVAEPDIRTQLLRVLRPRIVVVPPSVADAAASLSLHPRTLHRRLRDAGTSYRKIVAEARLELARQLLEGTRLDLRAIALALGYAEPSVFTHAFRRWTSMTPSDWRAQHLAKAPG